MILNFGPSGTLIIDNARIASKNFSGEEGLYNAKGERNFLLVIDDPDIVEALQNDRNEDGVGWNVKIRAPRNEGEEPFMFLPVKVKWNENGRGPKITLESNGNITELDESTVDNLDYIDIASVDLDIRPYDGIMRGTSHRTAYLNNMWVKQSSDRFESRRISFNRRED